MQFLNWTLLRFIIVTFLVLIFYKSSCATQTTIHWMVKKTENTILGFTIYYGLQSRYTDQGYLKSGFKYEKELYLPFANAQIISEDQEELQFSFTFSGSAKGAIFYFSMTAIAGEFNTESPYSDEFPVYFPSEKFSPIVFDLSFYIKANPDLLAFYGYNYEAIINHWLLYGIYEGRLASTLFDSTYYLNSYSDLKSAYENDYKAVVDHWLNYGVHEGRIASPIFNAHYYLETNKDLLNWYGYDYESVVYHWINYGIHEGRIASPIFSVRNYIQTNPDLPYNTSRDYEAAVQHYLLK